MLYLVLLMFSDSFIMVIMAWSVTCDYVIYAMFLNVAGIEDRYC
jgi:hypothetical protein